MNKGVILSLLVAGLITGSYIELQVNQKDDVVDVIEVGLPELPFEAVEPSAPVLGDLMPPPPLPPPIRVHFFTKSDGSIASVPASERDLSETPTFTPFTVAPSIMNRTEVVQAMEEAYPPLLRSAGIGGTVRVYFFIDGEGDVVKTQIDESSGHAPLDEAALRVASVYRFSPAMLRQKAVPVWVSFPITFQVR